MIAHGTVYVEAPIEKDPELEITMGEDNSSMEIMLRNAEQYAHVWFPVWSEEDGQDDLKWYKAEKNEDESWSYVVDMKDHLSLGTYYVHVYTGDKAPETMIAHGTVYVETELEAEIEELLVNEEFTTDEGIVDETEIDTDKELETEEVIDDSEFMENTDLAETIEPETTESEVLKSIELIDNAVIGEISETLSVS